MSAYVDAGRHGRRVYSTLAQDYVDRLTQFLTLLLDARPLPPWQGSMNRAEHLERCKTRALRYVDAGHTQNAFASMVSDLRKHSDTRDHLGAAPGTMQLMSGFLNSSQEVRAWIEGFH